MDEIWLKAAAAAIAATTGYRPIPQHRRKKPRVIDQLLRAKAESDRRNYAAKHAIMRQLILQYPDAFAIDSEDKGISGVTHRSGFRMHLPRTAIPIALKPLVRDE